jgi:hypothetical protein
MSGPASIMQHLMAKSQKTESRRLAAREETQVLPLS